MKKKDFKSDKYFSDEFEKNTHEISYQMYKAKQHTLNATNLMIERSELLKINGFKDERFNSDFHNEIYRLLECTKETTKHEFKPLSDEEKFNLLMNNVDKRTYNAFHAWEVNSWGIFKFKNRGELLKIGNFGIASFIELQKVVIRLGLKCAINPY